jgi:hypothetical protein
MKRIFTLLSLSLLIVSCSNDSESQDDSFFNLETGNLWVYKRFNSADGTTFTPSTRVDSVRVTETIVIDGENYSTLLHKVYNAGALSEEFEIHLREDASGHLVNEAGFVVHPGNDASYTHVRPIILGEEEQVGNVNYHLETPVDVTVEGQDYFVFPYIGDYIPLDSSEQTQYIFDQYQEHLGLVVQHCSAVFGPSCYQDRLIHHEVN